ncbi:MAG: GNAT family N-acetyltransferase [Candidatus Obscuribacter sp.]|nr:GNAT family N-acetyltransferase [Candidatus Obscuribacter sp.]
MIKITEWRQDDLVAIRSFIEQLQEHERSLVPMLKPGCEISADYLQKLLNKIEACNGLMLVARTTNPANSVGFICSWMAHDDDELLKEEARAYAYISDIFVEPNYRQNGIASKLLQEVEQLMIKRGAKQIRLCSKSANSHALQCYDRNGYSAYETILTKQIG